MIFLYVSKYLQKYQTLLFLIYRIINNIYLQNLLTGNFNDSKLHVFDGRYFLANTKTLAAFYFIFGQNKKLL